MRVGIAGARGSFSEEAARQYIAKYGSTEPNIEYLIGVEQVLSSLEGGDVEIGFFPIENSTGGVVIESVYAMAHHRFKVERLFNIEVQQNLLARKGVNPSEITAITSHDQALKQCRMYLKRKWPNVELKEYPDTAKAAEDLGNGELPESTAVIAPALCATLYDLDILEESIQDLKYNLTTFIAARKESS